MRGVSEADGISLETIASRCTGLFKASLSCFVNSKATLLVHDEKHRSDLNGLKLEGQSKTLKVDGS